jgi:hypothetical protein
LYVDLGWLQVVSLFLHSLFFVLTVVTVNHPIILRLPSVTLRALPNSLNVVVWFPDLIGCGVVDLGSCVMSLDP